MRKEIAACLSLFVFLESAAVMASEFSSNLLAVKHRSVSQLLALTERGIDGGLWRGGDLKDSRYFVLHATEGSGLIVNFTYLYTCDGEGKCDLVATKLSGSVEPTVSYDDGKGVFNFIEGGRVAMVLPLRLRTKLARRLG